MHGGQLESCFGGGGSVFWDRPWIHLCVSGECCPTCLVAGRLLCLYTVCQVWWAAEHPAGRLVVVRRSHRSCLTGGSWRRCRWPKCCPVPASPRPRELSWEVDSEGAEAAVGVSVQVVGVTGSPPTWFLLDEGVRPQRRVRSSKRGVRGCRGVEVQDRSPLRSCADGQGRATGARTRGEGWQQRTELTHIRSHPGQ